MCQYTYHHYPSCGHIASFTIESCISFLNTLRTDTWPGADPKSCTSIREHHDLLNTTNTVHCGPCERDWHQRLLTGGLQATLRSTRPAHSPIEGLGLSGPILTTQMTMQLTSPAIFERTFPNLRLDKESTASNTLSKPRFPNPHMPPPPSLAAACATPQELWSDVSFDIPHGETSATRASELGGNKIVNTDMAEPQMTSRSTEPVADIKDGDDGDADDEGDDEGDDDDGFQSVVASDTDCADAEDRAAFVMRQLDKLMPPSFRGSVPRGPSHASLRKTCPVRPALQPPTYESFPVLVAEQDTHKNDADDEDGFVDVMDEDYWNNRTALQSPIYVGFPTGEDEEADRAMKILKWKNIAW